MEMSEGEVLVNCQARIVRGSEGEDIAVTMMDGGCCNQEMGMRRRML